MRAFLTYTLIKLAALAGLLAGYIIYFVFGAGVQSTSPLVLLLMATAGFIFNRKSELSGGIFLACAGGSLLVHPFLFLSPTEYAVVGFLVFFAGLAGVLRWWKRSE